MGRDLSFHVSRRSVSKCSGSGHPPTGRRQAGVGHPVKLHMAAKTRHPFFDCHRQQWPIHRTLGSRALWHSRRSRPAQSCAVTRSAASRETPLLSHSHISRRSSCSISRLQANRRSAHAHLLGDGVLRVAGAWRKRTRRWPHIVVLWFTTSPSKGVLYDHRRRLDRSCHRRRAAP